MRKEKGITLVALIITIIVMMILVGVSVAIIINSDLLGTAKGAGTKYRDNMNAEQNFGTGNVQVNGMSYEQYMAQINGGNGGQGGNPEVENPDPEEPDDTESELPTYAEAEFNGEFLAENATFTNAELDNGLTAVVPAGFKIINGIRNNQSVADGLVIQDTTGNEFVWIPVVYTPAGDADDSIKKLDSAFLGTFEGTTADYEGCSEPYADGYNGEADDYYDMMKSVQNNFGFYIGRYEAGIDPSTNNARTAYADLSQTELAENGTSPMVVKRDCYPYNYVAWGKSMDDYATPIKLDNDTWEYSETGKDQGSGAVLLSKNLINSQTTGATSTLCYGVQWDAMLRFISSDERYDVDDSIDWGNYSGNDADITRQTARYTDSDTDWTLISETAESKYSKANSTWVILTTGASDEFEAKNIYDVAGNVEEFTMEAFYTTAGFMSALGRSMRGGEANNGYSRVAARGCPCWGTDV